jgi:hypothetical protein
VPKWWESCETNFDVKLKNKLPANCSSTSSRKFFPSNNLLPPQSYHKLYIRHNSAFGPNYFSSWQAYRRIFLPYDSDTLCLTIHRQESKVLKDLLSEDRWQFQKANILKTHTTLLKVRENMKTTIV